RHRDHRQRKSRSGIQGHDPHSSCQGPQLPDPVHRKSLGRALHRSRLSQRRRHYSRLPHAQGQEDRL
ncbi:hypothetical protein LTR16_012847, partial [Cryomyces antarcticus]